MHSLSLPINCHGGGRRSNNCTAVDRSIFTGCCSGRRVRLCGRRRGRRRWRPRRRRRFQRAKAWRGFRRRRQDERGSHGPGYGQGSRAAAGQAPGCDKRRGAPADQGPGARQAAGPGGYADPAGIPRLSQAYEKRGIRGSGRAYQERIPRHGGAALGNAE